jgi:hypothetical protein
MGYACLGKIIDNCMHVLHTAFIREIQYSTNRLGACGSVVVKAPALLVGRSRGQFPVVSLYFSVTYFPPTAPWSWSRLSL